MYLCAKEPDNGAEEPLQHQSTGQPWLKTQQQ